MKPIVAIVGRPNVGKSTLFNRITRTKDALVDDSPGVTRDRYYGDANWNDVEFTLVDTGGFTEGDDFADEIRFQVHQAIADADLILLMLDGKAGVSPFDSDILGFLRSIDKPIFYAVNKIDGAEQEIHLSEFYQLGLETLFPLSAEHRYGLTDLLDEMARVLSGLANEPQADPTPEMIRLAVVGRPNVGKSSLINRILGQDRLLVSDIPGTTRDAIDSVCKLDGKSYLLVDTAGIRRKGKVTRKLEKFSVIKALRSLERCDVALIVVDASVRSAAGARRIAARFDFVLRRTAPPPRFGVDRCRLRCVRIRVRSCPCSCPAERRPTAPRCVFGCFLPPSRGARGFFRLRRSPRVRCVVGFRFGARWDLRLVGPVGVGSIPGARRAPSSARYQRG